MLRFCFPFAAKPIRAGQGQYLFKSGGTGAATTAPGGGTAITPKAMADEKRKSQIKGNYVRSHGRRGSAIIHTFFSFLLFSIFFGFRHGQLNAFWRVANKMRGGWLSSSG